MYRFMKSSTRAFSSLVRSEYSNSMVSLPPSVGEWRCLPIGTDSLAIPGVFVASPRAGKASRPPPSAPVGPFAQLGDHVDINVALARPDDSGEGVADDPTPS